MQKETLFLPITSLSLFLAISVSIVWGLNFLMVKITLVEMGPLTLCAIRFFLASIPAIFLVPKPKVSLVYVLIYGLVTFALQFSLLFAGMAAGVSSSVAALIVQSQVFFAIFFSCLVIKQKLTFWQMSGGVISFAGIGIIALHRNLDCSLLGLILLLSSAICWGLGNLVSVKFKNVNMFSLVVWGSFIAFFPLAMLAFLFEEPELIVFHPQSLSLAAWLALFYITFISTYYGYGVWAWLLSKHQTASITPFALLCPIVAMLGSAYFFEEQFESWKLLSAGLVITGLCINIFGKKVSWLLLRSHRINPAGLSE
jgi:O-acetylserine/cysteine efflux transporter